MSRSTLLKVLPLLILGAIFPLSSPAQAPDPIHLDVVVTGKNGVPVSGLPQSAFTLLDNKSPQPITGFQAVGKDAPVSMVFVVDAVNVSAITMGYERQELEKFLTANNGELDRPTQLAILTDRGLQVQGAFTRDGNGLKQSLDSVTTGLRTIPRSTGYYGAQERLDISLNALRSLVARYAEQPGRKVIVWVSPGWPLISGVRTYLSNKEQDRIFLNVVELSTRLRQAGVTLYSVDPIGTNENIIRKFAYQQYVKGIVKPSQTDLGDLSLQVLVTQTGGIVLNSSNDIRGMLKKTVDDTSSYYELTFQPAPGEHPNEYHPIDVQVAAPGLTARTRQGYYAQPELPSQPVPVPHPAPR